MYLSNKVQIVSIQKIFFLIFLLWSFFILRTNKSYFSDFIREMPSELYIVIAVIAVIWVICCFIENKGLLQAKYSLIGIIVLVSLLAAILKMFTELIIFLWLVNLAIGVGKFVLNIFSEKIDYSENEMLVFYGGLGLGIIATLVFILGVLHLYYVPIFAILLVMLTLISIRPLMSFYRAIDFNIRLSINEVSLSSIIELSMIVFVVFCLIYLSLPEVYFDATWGHLAFPQAYLKSNSISGLDENFGFLFPQNAEMLFLLGLLFNSDILARLFNLLVYLFTGLGIWFICIRYMSRTFSLLAVALYLTTPLIGWEVSTAGIDLILTFFIFLSFYSLINFMNTEKHLWLYLCGVFVGFAFGTKLTAIFFAIPLLTVILGEYLFCWRSKGIVTLKAIAKFLGVIILCSAGWYMRAYVISGNPIFPFMNGIFKSPLWYQTNTMLNLNEFGMGKDLLSMIKLPWNVSVHPDKFADTGGRLGFGFLIMSPFTVAFFGLRRQPREMAYLLFITIVFSLFWIITAHYLRYYLPAIPFLSILLAYGADQSLARIGEGAAVRNLILISVLLIVISNTAFLIGSHNWFDVTKKLNFPRAFLLNRETKNEYLSRRLPSYSMYQYLNQMYGDTAKILTIGDNLQYYSRSRIIPLSPVNFLFWGLTEYSDPHALYVKLRNYNITHILVYEANMVSRQERLNLISNKFENNYLRLEIKNSQYKLYKLKALDQDALVDNYTQVNLLTNGSFEEIDANNNPKRWGKNGEPVLVREKDHIYDGKYAFYFPNDTSFFTQTVFVKPRTYYKLSHYAKADSGKPLVRLQVNWYDKHGVFLGTAIDVHETNNKFIRYETFMRSPEKADSGVVYANTHQGDAFLDYVEFIEMVK